MCVWKVERSVRSLVLLGVGSLGLGSFRLDLVDAMMRSIRRKGSREGLAEMVEGRGVPIQAPADAKRGCLCYALRAKVRLYMIYRCWRAGYALLSERQGCRDGRAMRIEHACLELLRLILSLAGSLFRRGHKQVSR